MSKLLISFASGLVFAVGLGLAGMVQPEKVLGFLDFTGTWDPTLAVVMGAALAVDLVLFPVLLKRKRPLFDANWHLPVQTLIDRRLVGGAVLFGAGWGLSGVCPGPALMAMTTLDTEPLVFGVAMLGGMAIFHVVAAFGPAKQLAPATPPVATAGEPAFATASVDG